MSILTSLSRSVSHLPRPYTLIQSRILGSTHVHCTCGSVGDPRTHGGDLGDLKRDFGEGFIAGFEIGDVDVTIWRGVDGVVDSGLEECQGSCQGYGVLPDIS